MLLAADPRAFESADERFSRCLFCGRELVLLPDDRRHGSCFDCLALSIPPTTACPRCGTMIPPEERGLGCPSCPWYPGGA